MKAQRISSQASIINSCKVILYAGNSCKVILYAGNSCKKVGSMLPLKLRNVQLSCIIIIINVNGNAHIGI